MKIPTLCKHKGTGQGYVTLHGERRYLGRFDQPETRAKYKRLIAEWLAGGGELKVKTTELKVCELLDRFLTYAKRHYVNPDGTPQNELGHYKQAMKSVSELYGSTLATAFGPLALKSVRAEFVANGWCRAYVNAQTDRVKRIFKWAVADELVPSAIYDALQKVVGLRAGKSAARENEPVKPVPVEHIEAVKRIVSRQVAGLIDLQVFTGARPGEILGIRPIDVDMTGKVWLLKPPTHKTAYRGHERIIYLGPRAQDVLNQFLAGRPVDMPFFCPIEAEKERWAECKTHRNKPVEKAKTKRRLRKAYDLASYRRAITRACETAGVPHWHPHQLRHNAATNLRREFGVDLARIVLGHRSAQVTLIYAEADTQKAIDAISKVG